MARRPSDATRLRTTLYELKQTQSRLKEIEAACLVYRQRATVAEQHVAEWKARFDVLLRRDMKEGE